MGRDGIGARLAAALVLLTIILAGYYFVARPYQLHWGATAEEIARPMPGDELAPDPDFSATRAITIDARPEEVWPWVVQLGYARAGFYGYDILEGIASPTGLRSATEILPQFQNPKPGEELLLSAAGGLQYHTVQPPNVLIWTGPEEEPWGQFLWLLEPTDDGQSRFISRIQWPYHRSQPGKIGMDLFTDFTDHIAVREILVGVKGRVEGTSPSNAEEDTEFFTYLVTFLLFVAGLVVLLVRPLTWARWLAVGALGLIWLVVCYGPGGLWVGLPLTVLALGLLWWAARA
jgi:hypothetical protein